MPQDAAAVFREAGLVTEETVVAKQEKSAPSSGGAWLTPLLVSVLFFLLCLLPFRQVDWLAAPLQILSLLLFILLSVFSHASGIGFNWLILALFPLTAPVGIVYMLCHMGDIYSLAQLLFVLGFFVRTLYYLYHHRNQVKKIILFKFINHSSI